jgi:hypothetical protein
MNGENMKTIDEQLDTKASELDSLLYNLREATRMALATRRDVNSAKAAAEAIALLRSDATYQQVNAAAWGAMADSREKDWMDAVLVNSKAFTAYEEKRAAYNALLATRNAEAAK